MFSINTLAKILVLAAIATMGLAVYNVYNNNLEPKSPKEIILQKKREAGVSPEIRLIKKEIKVDAKVEPLKEVQVSSEIAGIIEWLGVKEGDNVYKGQHVATIEHSELISAVNQAKAQVEKAEAELAKAKAGASEEDIALVKKTIEEAKIALAATDLDLQNDMRQIMDRIDDYIDEIDEFFTGEEDIDTVQFNVHYIDSLTLNSFEKQRKEIENSIIKLRQINEALHSMENTDHDTVRKWAADITDTIFKIKKLSDEMESAATDELKKYPNDKRLKELQFAMRQLRPSLEQDKKVLDKQISALDLALARLERANAEYDKVLAGPRQEEIDALEASIRLAEAQLRAAQSQLNKATVRVWTAGKVSQILKEEGERVSSMEPIMSVITDGVYVKAQVPEVDISKVSVGMPVEIKFDTYKSKRFNGEVYFIYPSQKEINHIVYYEIKVLPDKEEIARYDIKPGMTATVYIPIVNKEAKVAIPSRLIKKDEKGEYVYVLDKKAPNPNLPQKKYIESGVSDGEYTEVLSGLASYMKVLDKGE